MTAVLDIPTTGTAQRAPGRLDAWTILGTSVEGAETAEDALQKAHLAGWRVRKVGDVKVTEITDSGVTTLAMPGTFANLRTNPVTQDTEFLGAVGKRYNPIQIEEYTEALNLVRRLTGATFDRGGAYRGGARSYLTMRLPKALSVGGVDHHDLHVAAFFSYDGSAQDSLNLTPVRLTCGNMQTLAISRARRSFKIPHLSSASVKIGEVERALAGLFGYQDAFAAEAERMLNTPVTLGQFERIVHRIWTPPVAPNKRTLENWQTRTTALRTLFQDADTQANIRGTAWAAWNAVGEYLDHYAPARTEATRAERSLASSEVQRRKNLAHRLVWDLAA